MLAICSGVAEIPAIAIAGSPGIKWIIAKVIRLTISRIGNAPSSRRTSTPPIRRRSAGEPDVCHARYAEWDEAVDVGSGGLNLGKGSERKRVDAFQYQLLHA